MQYRFHRFIERSSLVRWIILARHSCLGEGDRAYKSLPTYNRETHRGWVNRWERWREKGQYRDNNAFYQATRIRSLKEFIPTGQAGRILSMVSLSILPTNLSSSVGEQNRPAVKALADRVDVRHLSRYTRSRNGTKNLVAPSDIIHRPNLVWQKSDTLLWRAPTSSPSCPFSLARWVLSDLFLSFSPFIVLIFSRSLLHVNREIQQCPSRAEYICE